MLMTELVGRYRITSGASGAQRKWALDPTGGGLLAKVA